MKKLLLTCIILSVAIITQAQWYKSEGLSGGDVSYLVCHDSVMMASIFDKGVFRKTTNTEWEKVNEYINNNTAKLLKAGDCIIIITGESPLRSFDGGLTWEDVYNVGSWNYANVIDSVLFWGSGMRLRSFDYGDTYDTIDLPPPPPDSYISYSYTCDSFFYVIYQSGDYEETSNIYYSDNYGNTWDTITTAGVLDQQYFVIDEIYYLNGTFWAELFLGSGPSTIIVLDTTINEWVFTGTGYNISGSIDMTSYAGKVLLSSPTHPVQYFEDSTLQWIPFTTPQLQVNEFVMHEGELYTACQQGVYRLDSTGIYYPFNEGLSFRNINCISSNSGKIFVSANNEIYTSDNKGQSFELLPDAWGFQVIATDSVIYTLSDHDLRLSRDDGVTWETYDNRIRCPSGSSFTHLSITNNYYYLGSMQGLYRSTPALNNWLQLTNGPFYEDFWVDNVEAINRTVFANEYFSGQRLYRSDNFGIEFYDYGSNQRLRKVDNTFYIINDSLHFSSDEGDSWQTMNFKTNHQGYCAFHKGDTIVVGGRDNNGDMIVDINYNHGNFWLGITDNLPNTNPWGEYVNNINIMDGTILIGYPMGGVWYRDDILTNNKEVVMIEKNIVNVFPNPATENINIKFDNLNHGTYSFILSDLSGKVVINHNNRPNTSNDNVINISMLSPGIYLYKLKTAQQTITGKLIVK